MGRVARSPARFGGAALEGPAAARRRRGVGVGQTPPGCGLGLPVTGAAAVRGDDQFRGVGMFPAAPAQAVGCAAGQSQAVLAVAVDVTGDVNLNPGVGRGCPIAGNGAAYGWRVAAVNRHFVPTIVGHAVYRKAVAIGVHGVQAQGGVARRRLQPKKMSWWMGNRSSKGCGIVGNWVFQQSTFLSARYNDNHGAAHKFDGVSRHSERVGSVRMA